MAFPLNISREWSLIFPFVPFLAPLENIFCPPKECSKRYYWTLLGVTAAVHWSAIFSLCFILLCKGWLGCPGCISKRFTLYFTLCNSRKCLWGPKQTMGTKMYLFSTKRHLLEAKRNFFMRAGGIWFCGLSCFQKESFLSAFMPLCIKQLSTFKSKNRKLGGFLFIDLVLK